MSPVHWAVALIFCHLFMATAGFSEWSPRRQGGWIARDTLGCSLLDILHTGLGTWVSEENLKVVGVS